MTGRARIAFHAGLATLAAATALGAVFDGFGWLFPVAGGVAVVVVVSELVRLSPLPAALGPILVAVGVWCYVTAAYAGSTAIAHFIPNGASMHVLAKTTRAGFHDIRTLGTPVPTHRGLVLIAIVGIAAVALVVDLMAVTMRRAALAGLPLLTIFALSTSVAKRGTGWVPFAVGAAGYLWLLLADSRDRLARWGRPLGFEREGRPHFTWSDQDVMPSPLSVMGRRIGLSAIAIGLVVPLLIPGLRGGIPHGGGGGFGFGHGSSERFTVNPIVTIRGQLLTARSRPVLSMQTTDPEPGYIRLTALDRFDGTTFAPSTMIAPVEAQVSRGIVAPSVDGPLRRAEISIGGLDVPWLPLPTQVTAVDVPGDWRYDRTSNTVFSARSSTRNLRYSAAFVRVEPSVAELRQVSNTDPSVVQFLQLPDLPQEISDLTDRVTSDAKAVTQFDKAVAIQRFLTSPPFAYDTSVPGDDSTNALSRFLLETHRGFCQQYAAAMAVMARIAHIPSRVAVGFTRGQQQTDGSWLVTTHDAHAWPELYFSGFGWLPFEPTPRGDGQAVPPAYTQPQSSAGGDGSTAGGGKGGKGGTANPSTGRSKSQRFDDRRDAAGPLPVGPAPTVKSAHHTRRNVTLALLVIIGVALVAPSIARVVERRRRWSRAVTPAERANAAWAELRASAIDARAGWVDGLSPRATARVLQVESVGLATAELRALDRLVTAVQRAWYAADHAPRGTESLEDDVDAIRAALFEDLTWGERLVLRAWPRSTLAGARDLLGRFGQLLDAVDLAGARLRARLRPRHA